VGKAGVVDAARADAALRRLEVDERGLDAMDRRYLGVIARDFQGGPVGVETISAALSEPRDAIEDIVEPYLIQQGFVQRTPRGRLLTPQAFAHLGLAAPSRPGTAQAGLFPDAGDAWPGCAVGPAVSRGSRTAAAGVFRGHRFLGAGLPCPLPALHGARPLRLPAPARHPARRTGGGGAGVCGAAHGDRLPRRG